MCVRLPEQMNGLRAHESVGKYLVRLGRHTSMMIIVCVAALTSFLHVYGTSYLISIFEAIAAQYRTIRMTKFFNKWTFFFSQHTVNQKCHFHLLNDQIDKTHTLSTWLTLNRSLTIYPVWCLIIWATNESIKENERKRHFVGLLRLFCFYGIFRMFNFSCFLLF